MRIATAVLVGSSLALSGCGSSSDEPSEGPTSASPSASESASTTPEVPATAEDLVGDWTAASAEWTVHFKADGTFVEDYQGVTDFRVGTYEIADGTVSLIGDDGNTDKGAVEGSTLVFKLGTLERK
ncbi:hypothetical protein [Aeromicrobium terrae]|uniref:hypothetical protein n=1 Tax=Aeromicrobium terrae TaxID=2498846 RepID=UPI00165074A0|nr:hypothetical protein [Aeromicrobium terrae]